MMPSIKKRKIFTILLIDVVEMSNRNGMSAFTITKNTYIIININLKC